MFPPGSSSTSNPPEQCITIVIKNDRTPKDQDDYFNLAASSSDSSVFFTPGRKNVSVLIQDDDSKLYVQVCTFYAIVASSISLYVLLCCNGNAE